MNVPLSKGDEAMRKASVLFAKGKLQKAWSAYGQAIQAYRGEPESLKERIALAHYTRALLVLRGGATGDAARDIEAGAALAAAGGFEEAPRFAGLFEYLGALRARQDERIEDAQEAIDRARATLDAAGRPLDLHEIELEQMEIAADAKDRERLDRAAKAALDRAATAKHVLVVKQRLARIHEDAGRAKEALEVLEEAASRAFETEQKEALWELQARIKNLRARYPELPE